MKNCKEKMRCLLLIIAVVLIKPARAQNDIHSPDGRIVLHYYQKKDATGKRTLYYQVAYKNKPVIHESVLDIQLDNHLSEMAMALKVDTSDRWCENLVIQRVVPSSKDTTWQPVYGEKKTVRDHYNALTVELVKEDNPIYVMHLQFRVYDAGVAIRYFFPENPKGTYYRVVAEHTEFSLPEGTKAWHTPWAQGPYKLLPLQDWCCESERPLTLQLPDGIYACLAEAQLTDYARTKFALHPNKPNTIITSMHDPADLISPVATPWRVIMIAEKPGDLIEHNDLVLNLNEPNKIKEAGWIQPGKIIRIMNQTTADAKSYIDFAATHHLQYVLFDWKWYGPAFSFDSDATKVVAPLDMPGIIQYGKEKGIGVWLYVNQQGLLSQSDTLFSVYKKWGVKGVKFGFVQVGSHRWTTWLNKAIQQAAASNIMVNIHDDWRPTGEQRTWPNLMTAEGIRGNEEMPDATHNTILPFTRYIAGAADYTICYYDQRIKTTHAHQLALAAIYYSPIQTLFWYDKPSLFENEPEITFFEQIPTVWDETKVIQGEPGQYITMARRQGENWFVGTITNKEARSLQLPLDFLTKGKKYIATIYCDDAKTPTKTKVKVEEKKVDVLTVLNMSLMPSGGQAIWIRPVLSSSFVHPGILHNREDLDRMKKAVANKEEPMYAGYQLFIQNPASQFDYKMQGPLPVVGRNPTVGQTIYDNDANAAHQNAVMWAITGDQRYANKAIEIINAWSSTLKSITGRDAVLMAGLGPFKMVNAAEIIRYTNAGWSDADIQQTEKHFKEVIYPVIENFAPFANGNWDAAAIKTVMAIGVFCNDRDIYERALRYYVNGSGNGRLTHYIINEEGQVQETGRDQPHTQLGLALLSDACEIAWHQGLDLYGYANNRLLKGFEYTAKYNLGNEVPFTHVLDRTGKYEHVKPSDKGRGELRAVYEQVYNHYVNRMGLQAPYTARAAAKIRPEGPGKPGADHPGYGTLYYTRPAGSSIINNSPAAPGALIANGTNKEIALTWIASIGADAYTVKRSTKSGGPYTTIANNITRTNYVDKQVQPGTIYYYTVSASNVKGESGDAYETSIAAGLPAPWKQQDIGKVSIAGHANYDGEVYTVEGSGSGPIRTKDTCHFVYMPLQGDGIITARLYPEPSSQFSRMGLMMRESLAADAAHASLLLFPGQSGSIEAPSWQLRLITRATTGASTTIEAMGNVLTDPAVTYGRLTGYYWLRLQRSGNTFTGYGSYDGKEWTSIGSVTISLKKSLLIGIPVASGINNSTFVRFDQVTISK